MRLAHRRKTVVVIGNCFSEALVSGLSSATRAANRFQFVAIPLHLKSLNDEMSRRWIASSTYVFVQQLGGVDWSALHETLPSDCQMFHYPDIILRSPWPFSASSGHPDAVAKVFPQNRIRHFDGALAHLRIIEPDHQRRFQRYCDLDFGWTDKIDQAERMQDDILSSMDHASGTGLGAFVKNNYRSRRLFYSTTHASALFFQELCGFAWRKLDLPEPVPAFTGIDSWNDWSVPVHPRIAQHLRLTWADENTYYLYRSLGELTWEAWVKNYIATFG